MTPLPFLLDIGGTFKPKKKHIDIKTPFSHIMKNQKVMVIQVFFNKGFQSFQSIISTKEWGNRRSLESGPLRGGPANVSNHLTQKLNM